MHTTSASLLLRLREPDPDEAWGRFVRIYSPLLYAWTRRMGLQDADAADLVQDVFTTLLHKLPEFDHDRHKRFRGWLWTVTQNKFRERRRLRSLPIDGSREPESLPAPPRDGLEEEEFRHYLLLELVPRLQEQFQPSTWRAFWEHLVEGRPATEVAKRLGVGKSAICMAKVRILAAMQKELGDLIDS